MTLPYLLIGVSLLVIGVAVARFDAGPWWIPAAVFAGAGLFTAVALDLLAPDFVAAYPVTGNYLAGLLSVPAVGILAWYFLEREREEARRNERQESLFELRSQVGVLVIDKAFGALDDIGLVLNSMWRSVDLDALEPPLRTWLESVPSNPSSERDGTAARWLGRPTLASPEADYPGAPRVLTVLHVVTLFPPRKSVHLVARAGSAHATGVPQRAFETRYYSRLLASVEALIEVLETYMRVDPHPAVVMNCLDLREALHELRLRASLGDGSQGGLWQWVEADQTTLYRLLRPLWGAFKLTTTAGPLRAHFAGKDLNSSERGYGNDSR